MRARSALLVLVLAIGTAPLAAMPSSADSAPSTLTTVGLAGDGDGGPATQARVPAVVARGDTAGNVLLLERTRLRRVDAATGAVTTLAGSPYPGTAVDGQAALSALIPTTEPGRMSLAVASSGAVTVGVGNAVWQLDGPVVRARPWVPDDQTRFAAAADGTLYAHRVSYAGGGLNTRLVSLAPGDAAWTDLGASAAAPTVATDSLGTLHAGGNGSVFRRDGATWTRVAGGGAADAADGVRALDARLDQAFTVLPDGTVVVTSLSSVFRVDTDGVLRSVPAPSSELIGGVGGDLLVSHAHAVWRVPMDGRTPLVLAGPGAAASPDGTPLIDAVDAPAELCRDGSGRVLFSSGGSVRGADDHGRLVTRQALPPGFQDGFSCAADGTAFVVLRADAISTSPQRVVAVAPDGSSRVVAGGGTADPAASDGAVATTVALSDVLDVEVDADGVVYLVEASAGDDVSSYRLYAVLPDGTWRRVAGFGTDLTGPALTTAIHRAALTVDPTSGRLLVASTSGVRRLSADRAAFTRLTTLLSRLATVLPDGTLLVWDGYRFVHRYADGRTAVLAGGCSVDYQSCSYSDTDDPLWLRFDDVTDLAADGADVTFLQRVDGPAYLGDVVLRRLALGAAPVFRDAAPLTASVAPATASTPASITITTQTPSDGDRLVLVQLSGTTPADSVNDGTVVNQYWTQSGGSQSVTVPGLAPGDHTFTAFRVTAAGATSRGTSVSVAVDGSTPESRIEALWQSTGGASGFLGAPTSEVHAVRGGWARTFAGGHVYADQQAAYEVHGLILQRYLALGGPGSYLGLPRSNELVPADGRGRLSEFAGGTVAWSSRTGAQDVRGAIRERWRALGATRGFLGYPRTGELVAADGVGRVSEFEGGTVVWSSPTGAHEVHGLIAERWRAMGGVRSVLGYPTTDEQRSADGSGAFSEFRGGTVTWTPATGPHAIYGAIRDRWIALGREVGPLGMPATSELGTPDGIGRYNHFTRGGSVYWTPGTGAHAVYGAIRNEWARLGWERSWLGYPTRDEYAIPDGGRRSNFTGGHIVWYQATGARAGR